MLDSKKYNEVQIVAEVNHIILVGAGGCMRELAWQIQELNKEHLTWQIDGYVDAKVPALDERCIVGAEEIPFLGDDAYLLAKEEPVNVAICVGNPRLRKKIADGLRRNPNVKFPNLILGDTRICEDVQMGEGCIISMDARISTNVVLGDFVFLNTGSMICHDGRLGDFVTMSPFSALAGAVTVEAGVEIGMGAKVIQGMNIGQDAIVGAAAVVVKDVDADCTVVGVPAKRIKG